ncbi:MAG: FadR/GntR family transcriptional regulator [Pseudomonadota bacterium]|nr:FadR/GntR family transcriptional regulator [Pseudomonadota bacterium]
MNEVAPAKGSRDLGRNLTHGLLDAVGKAIIAGEYDSRSFPTEAQLSSQYGVSRSVTREAIKMLGAKGMVAARPKQGTFLQSKEAWNLFDPDVLRWILDSSPTLDQLRWFNELRIGIEPQAAALAARHANDDQLEAIAAGLRRMEQAELGLDDPLTADIEFHAAVLRASNNPFYAQFRELVSAALNTSIRFTNRIAGHTADIAEHAAVFAAIRGGNAKAALKSMEALIENVLDVIVSRGGTIQPPS